MKLNSFKSLFYAILFAAVSGFVTVSLFADSIVPVNVSVLKNADTSDFGNGDTTDRGGVIFPGTGH